MGNHSASMNKEMKMYRLRLKPDGSFRTSWSSDTLTGALFWAYYRRAGEDALAQLLREFRLGYPRFVLSSGFPGDLLPKPFLPAARQAEKPTLEQLRLYKKIKKTEWLTSEDFNCWLLGKQAMPQELPPPFFTELVMHNEVSRLTGTTGDTHSLFAMEETFLNESQQCITVYAFVREDWQSSLRELFADLGKGGIGARASTGKGTFCVSDCDEFNFSSPQNFNGYILLGNAVPKAADPARGYMKIDVKRGKLGEEKSKTTNPFKKPLLMLKPGSVFYSQRELKWIGRIVGDIAPGFPESVQCGMAVVIPAILPEKQQAWC